MSNAVATELGAAAEIVSSYQHRLAALASDLAGHDRDDLLTAIVEAERALGVAERAIRRAQRIGR